MTDLRDLEKRLSEAQGADRELDLCIMQAAGIAPKHASVVREMALWPEEGGKWGYVYVEIPKLTSSLDAAIALAERLLPHKSWSMSKDMLLGVWSHTAMVGDANDAVMGVALGKSPALALLLALVRALQAKEVRKMKLDRDIEGNEGRGKYALLKLRDAERYRGDGPFAGCGEIGEAIRTLDNAGLIEWGHPNTEGEFFVIKLRDQYAQYALNAYAAAADLDDHEYGRAVQALADRSGDKSPFCKRPD